MTARWVSLLFALAAAGCQTWTPSSSAMLPQQTSGIEAGSTGGVGASGGGAAEALQEPVTAETSWESPRFSGGEQGPVRFVDRDVLAQSPERLALVGTPKPLERPSSIAQAVSFETPLTPESTTVAFNPRGNISALPVAAPISEPIAAPIGGPMATPITAPPARPLTLDEAIAIALQRNPDLVALRQDVPVSSAALAVAQVYPHNPSVTVGVDPLAKEFDGPLDATKNAVALTQTFELAHQTRYRTQTAAADLTRAQWSVLRAQTLTVAETERRYFTAVYLRQLYEFNRSTADLDASLLAALQRRFQAGQSSAADVALARIEARAAQQQARLAEIEFRDALSALQTYLGWSEQLVPEPVEKLAQWQWIPADAALTGGAADLSGPNPPADVPGGNLDLESLVTHRPDIQSAMAELQAAQAQWCLAKASRVPNVTFGPTYERDESRTLFVGVEMQMDVPVIDSGRALVCQRQAEIHRKHVALQQSQVKARLEIRAALERYQRARAIVEQFGREGDGRLDEEIQRAADLFLAGEADLLTVYTIRGKVLQAQKDYLDALNELAQAAAALTAATAASYHSLVAPNPPMLPK